MLTDKILKSVFKYWPKIKGTHGIVKITGSVVQNNFSLWSKDCGFLSLTVWKLHQHFQPRAPVICGSSIDACQNIHSCPNIKISTPVQISKYPLLSKYKKSTHVQIPKYPLLSKYPHIYVKGIFWYIKISTQLSSVGINPAQPNVILIIWNGDKWEAGMRERVTDPGSLILGKGPRYLRRVSRNLLDALASI